MKHNRACSGMASLKRASVLTIPSISWTVAVLLGLFLLPPAYAQKKLSASEAKEHYGENATVCGEVVSARYASTAKGEPTFLNLDKTYPNQIFTVVI
jgi:hypothetical protein